MVHEFAHTVKNLGLVQSVQDSVGAALSTSLSRRTNQLGQSQPPNTFTNADEYFAGMSEAWFESTDRTDTSLGVDTRSDVLALEPEVASVFQNYAYGPNPWRYVTDPDLPHATVGASRRQLRPGVTTGALPGEDGDTGRAENTLPAVPQSRFQISREELEALAALRRPDQVWVRP